MPPMNLLGPADPTAPMDPAATAPIQTASVGIARSKDTSRRIATDKERTKPYVGCSSQVELESKHQDQLHPYQHCFPLFKLLTGLDHAPHLDHQKYPAEICFHFVSTFGQSGPSPMAPPQPLSPPLRSVYKKLYLLESYTTLEPPLLHQLSSLLWNCHSKPVHFNLPKKEMTLLQFWNLLVEDLCWRPNCNPGSPCTTEPAPEPPSGEWLHSEALPPLRYRKCILLWPVELEDTP